MLDVGIKGTLQEIALKVAEQQMKEQEFENMSKESTIFVLGSKEVVSLIHIIPLNLFISDVCMIYFLI